MAQSRFVSEQYMSDQFVESAGAVLFRLSTEEVCVLHHLERDEIVLAKGRRNCNESRHEAAIREIEEETGYIAHLISLTMETRAPPSSEDQQCDDISRELADIYEPISLQLRRLAQDDIKLIWWYVADLDGEADADQDPDDAQKFRVEFYGYDQVLSKLTFQMDRDVVRKAIELVRKNNLLRSGGAEVAET